MNRVLRSALLTFVLLGLAGGVVAACGGGDDHAGHDHEAGDDHSKDKAK